MDLLVSVVRIPSAAHVPVYPLSGHLLLFFYPFPRFLCFAFFSSTMLVYCRFREHFGLTTFASGLCFLCARACVFLILLFFLYCCSLLLLLYTMRCFWWGGGHLIGYVLGHLYFAVYYIYLEEEKKITHRNAYVLFVPFPFLLFSPQSDLGIFCSRYFQFLCFSYMFWLRSCVWSWVRICCRAGHKRF